MPVVSGLSDRVSGALTVTVSVARLSLPSVVAQWLPTSCQVQVDSRVPIYSACSNTIRRFGKQVGLRASSGTASRRGDTGGSGIRLARWWR